MSTHDSQRTQSRRDTHAIVSAQSPHIGILWNHPNTLSPKSEIEAFLWNLIGGLLALPTPPKITLLTGWVSHEPFAKKLAGQFGSQIRIRSTTEAPQKRLLRWRRRLDTIRARLDRICHILSVKSTRLAHLVMLPAASIWHGERNAWQPGGDRCPPGLRLLSAVVAAAVLAVLAPPTLLTRWGIALLNQWIFAFLFPSLRFPLRLAARLMPAPPATPLECALAAADCDVWLLPGSPTEASVRPAHVLVLHDLRHDNQPARDRAEQATLIYSPTRNLNFVSRFGTTIGNLRSFPLAPPAEEANPNERVPDLATLRWKYALGGHFLYYPAALLPHKNHAGLVRALGLLRDGEEQSALELVCTGAGTISHELRRTLEELNIGLHVHFLGVVPAEDERALYRHAQLVVLPSVQETFPVGLFESFQNGCPVVCADIPGFRELMEDHPETVLFFDPHNANSMAVAIRRVLAQRSRFQTWQRDAYRQMAQRDWRAVAHDFLDLFEEARVRATAHRNKSATWQKGPH